MPGGADPTMSVLDWHPTLAALEAHLVTSTGLDRITGELIRDGLRDLGARYSGSPSPSPPADAARALAAQLRSALDWLAAARFT
jgi:hypothetical protein